MKEEAKRLDLIGDLKIAGTRGPSSFRRICEMAAELCGAPMSAVTVVDRMHCWFYAEHNVNLRSVPRDSSLCAETIRSDAPSVVEDARSLVEASGGTLMPGVEVGAYIGAPIVYKPGVRIGSVCVIDPQPRSFTAEQIRYLQSLSQFAVEALRLEQVILSQQNIAIEAFEAKALVEQKNLALELANADMEAAADLANIGFWSYDIARAEFDVSASSRRILGVDEATSPAKIKQLLTQGAESEFEESIANCARSGDKFEVRTQLRATVGEEKWLRTVGRAEVRKGGPTRIRGCTQDITSSVRSRGQISRLAALDTLTGLHNRRFLPMAYMKLRRETEFDAQKLTLLLIDLDNFKSVNDTKGHDSGDEVLVEVAKILLDGRREGDVVGRVGGDEFLIILRDRRDADIGEAVSARLAKMVSSSAVLQQFPMPISLSIGYTDIDDNDTEFTDALKQADLAVFEAKRRGRACAVGYAAALGDASSRRAKIFEEIDGAIRAGEIVPAYQAKISLSRGEILGFEALARWRHPERGLLPPGAFLEALEHPVYGQRISDAILEQAIRDLRRLVDRGWEGLQVAVNVTELQLVDTRFPSRFAALCAENGIPPDRIVLEITEKILLTRQVERIQETLNAVAELGSLVAFDDFGTGYASLTHLREFKIDEIKIDRSFVADLVTNSTTRAISASVVRMAHDLGVHVVAEGIETDDVERVLLDMGCEIGQGYLYSKPVVFDEAVALLAARRTTPAEAPIAVG